MNSDKNESTINASRLGKIWQKWSPRGSARRLVSLCLLGWIIVNSSALSLELGMPVFGWHSSLMAHLGQILQILSGLVWIRDWLYLWQWLPVILPLSIFDVLVWLKKPNIFTAAILAVAGMVAEPANHMLFGQLAFVTLPFTAIFQGCARITQKIWDNWDAPAPTPEDKRKRVEKRKKSWPARKRMILVAIPFLICGVSSCLCALCGAYRKACAIAVVNCGEGHHRYFSKNWMVTLYSGSERYSLRFFLCESV